MLKEILARPLSVLVGAALVVVIGAVSLTRLPVSLLPTLERPQLRVLVEDSERSRHVLQADVVEDLERRLLAMEDVVSVRARVDDGEAQLVVQTNWQTDVDRLRLEAERELASVDSLGVDAVSVTTRSGDLEAVVELAVHGAGRSSERTEFVRQVLVPELARLPGVGRVRRTGGTRQTLVVTPVAAALAARGLTSVDVAAALEGVGTSRPLGSVRDGGLVRSAVVRETVDRLETLRGLRLGPSNLVALRDIAEVALEERLDEGVYFRDGEEAVLVQLFRAPGANAVQMARGVREVLAEITGRAPRGLRLEVVRDTSVEVVSAIRELALAALLGLGLGTVVLRLALGSWLPTLSLVVVVPASIVSTFGAFFLWGVAIDIVALAGLALALGMLVDNAIVVVESIETERARRPADGSRDGRVELVGTSSVALALVASLLTTAAVFVPLIYLRGLAYAFFGVQAFAIVSALALSLALSLTLTPLLARFSGLRTTTRHPGRACYLALLERLLRRRGPVILGAFVAAALPLVLVVPWLDRELVPGGRGAEVEVAFTLPGSLTPEGVRASVAGLASSFREVLQTQWPGARFDVSAPQRRRAVDPALDDDVARARFVLPVGARGSLPELAQAIRDRLADLPGVQARTVVQRELFARTLLRLSGDQRIEVSAGTRSRAEHLAELVRAALLDEGLAGAPWEARAEEEWVVGWDRSLLRSIGLESDAARRAARAALGGLVLGRMPLDDSEVDVVLESPRARQIGLVPILRASRAGGERSAVEAGPAGDRVVSLEQAATLRLDRREPPWLRANGRPAQIWQADADARRAAEIEAMLREMPMAADERVRLLGSSSELRSSFVQLRLTMLLALLLVFLTVAALYESLLVPLAVAATVPVSLGGAVLALGLSMQSLNVMSLLGMILLVGIVVNNSIVLVTRLERGRRAAGGAVGLAELALEAARDRYRPILMTTSTTVLSMLPLALLGGEGVELRRALAITVIGGMVAGVFASLVVVPVLWTSLTAWRRDAR